MSSVKPNLAQGTILNISADGTTFKPIQLVDEIQINRKSSSLGTEDLSSTGLTYIKGMPDSLDISANFRYDFDSDTDTLINNNLNGYGSTAFLYCKLSLAGLSVGKTYTFQGHFTDFSFTNKTNAIRTGTLAIKANGDTTVV